MTANRDAERPRSLGEATLRSEPGAAAAARALVSEWLDGRAGGAVIADARLLVTELVANSVRHAAAPAGSPLRVDAVELDGVIRVALADRGVAGNIRAQATGGLAGGYGLAMVEALAVRWGVSRERGTVVWFELASRKPARAG